MKWNRSCEYDPDNFSSDLARINRQNGLKWTCLDFRRTFGSMLAMKGELLYIISTLLGNIAAHVREFQQALLSMKAGFHRGRPHE